MINHKAFSMLELVFVIVIMGIIGKFGVEFLAQSYNTYLYAKIDDELHANSNQAVEFISKRLEYRIRGSAIKRKPSSPNDFISASDDVSDNDQYNILEWIGFDNDGFRGDSKPFWSGIIDLDDTKTDKDKLYLVDTNTSKIDDLIKILSHKDSNISIAAIVFNSADFNLHELGWKGSISSSSISNHKAIHPINKDSNKSLFISASGDFTDLKVYNRYQLTWTAYAVVQDGTDLLLYYDYQPWEGEEYSQGKSSTIMQNISTFRIEAKLGMYSIIVCTKNSLIKSEDYSKCKEKVIF